MRIDSDYYLAFHFLGLDRPWVGFLSAVSGLSLVEAVAWAKNVQSWVGDQYVVELWRLGDPDTRINLTEM